jgi:hypothetical protein
MRMPSRQSRGCDSVLSTDRIRFDDEMQTIRLVALLEEPSRAIDHFLVLWCEKEREREVSNCSHECLCQRDCCVD